MFWMPLWIQGWLVVRGSRSMNHVLIVDDEAEIRGSLEGILREEDYIVTTAATAAEALELRRDAAYDVVLLDIWLPDRDGLDPLTEIRQRERRIFPGGTITRAK